MSASVVGGLENDGSVYDKEQLTALNILQQLSVAVPTQVFPLIFAQLRLMMTLSSKTNNSIQQNWPFWLKVLVLTVRTSYRAGGASMSQLKFIDLQLRTLLNSGFMTASLRGGGIGRIHKVFVQKRIRCEWQSHYQTDETSPRVVLYLHGGGYCFLSAGTHRNLTLSISELASTRIFSVNYRLAPRYQYPCALEDALDCYMHVINREDPSRVIVAGDSAGGGLSMALLLLLLRKDLPLPAGVVLLSPWVDLTCEMDSWERHKLSDYLPHPRSGGIDVVAAYLGQSRCDDRQTLTDPLVSPLHAHSFRGMPPVLIQCGSAERIHDEAELLAERMKNDDVSAEFEVYPGMVHVFQAFPFLPQARTAIDSIARFIATLAEPSYNPNQPRSFSPMGKL
jgi:acetyl esterase/lipase